MYDEIQVVNSALMLLRDKRITSFTDGSERATLAHLRFPLVRDAVLESHPWNFAVAFQALAEDPNPMPTGFSYAHWFVLPTDPWCIAIRNTNQICQAWAKAGRRLLCNDDAISIEYTARIEDLNAWSPLAVQALTYLLASDFAGPITGQANKTQQWQQAFSWAIAEAKLSDGREGTPVVVQPNTTLTRIR